MEKNTIISGKSAASSDFKTLFPTSVQKKYIDNCIDLYRSCYNVGLQLKGSAFNDTGEILNTTALITTMGIRELPEEYDWILEKAIADLMASFYAKKGIPPMLEKTDYLRIPHIIEIKEDGIKLPRLGWIKSEEIKNPDRTKVLFIKSGRNKDNKQYSAKMLEILQPFLV